MNDEGFKKLTVLLRKDLFEALTQESNRLNIPKPLIVRLLIKEFLKDSDNKIKELKELGILK
jgi:hypothetical protein